MKTRRIFIGNVAVGNGARVSIQSMCNTPTADVAATLAQIRRLAAAGCEIIRLAVPDAAAAEAFKSITAPNAGTVTESVTGISFISSTVLWNS